MEYIKGFKHFINEDISDEDIESVFGDLGLYSLTGEQMDFLDQYVDGEWTHDSYSNQVDIKGSFVADNAGLLDFYGINFGRVTRSFWCQDNPGLRGLDGAPDWVGGGFYCHRNEGLQSLEGAPDWVGGGFWCHNNPGLRSLEGAPDWVGGDFFCHDNPGLRSLEGAPGWVGGSFFCHNNPGLRSLDGIGKVEDKIRTDSSE